jgi:hypothetical protein
MLILPLRGDKISIADLADEQEITSYSALKPGGAVYLAQPLDPKFPFIAISAIEAINGVYVTQKSSGMFVPKGLIKRKQNLPQPGDIIEIILSKSPQGLEDRQELEVTDVTLTDKPANPVVIHCDKTKLTLADIKGIKRKLGFEVFNEKAFKKLYLDYLPVGIKE